MGCTSCIFAHRYGEYDFQGGVETKRVEKLTCLKLHLGFDDVSEEQFEEIDAGHVDCPDRVEGRPLDLEGDMFSWYISDPAKVVPDARQREAHVAYNIAWRFQAGLETEEGRARLLEQYIDQEVPEAYVREMIRVYGSFQGAMAKAGAKGRAVLFAWWGRTKGGAGRGGR